MELGEKYKLALSLTLDFHGDQKRKKTDIPYMSHLMAVSAIIMENGGTEDQAIAGLLHDAVEDCDGENTLRTIRQELGENVADLVMECTDTMENPKPDWAPRKRRYIASLKAISPEGRLVSLADKVHNISCILRDFERIGDKIFDRFWPEREETVWYYRELAKEYSRLDSTPLTKEFEGLVRELESLD